jgi:hypothetical protein
MFKLKYLVILAWFLIAVQPCFGDDYAKTVGTWRLVSFESESQATAEREPVLGKNPTGYIVFTPERRLMLIITGEGRNVPKTDQDRAALLKSMIAYTGMYRIEGDKRITKVDVSWNPDWVGTDVVRFFRIDGDRLQIISDWMQSVVRPERGKVRAILTWERAK